MILYENTTPPTDEQILGNEYVGFQLGYFQSPDMGIKRINTNNRYQQPLVPNFELKTNQDTKIGTRLYKQEVKDKQIRIDFAFDSLTQNEFDQVKNWLGNNEIQPLQFYEDGQVIYVKLQGQPNINYICFDEERDGIVQRIYKGEGSVNFIQYKFNVTKAKKKYQDLVLKYVDFEKSYYDSTDETPEQILDLSKEEEWDPYKRGTTATMTGDINRYHLEYKNSPSEAIKEQIKQKLSLFYPFNRIGYYFSTGGLKSSGPVVPDATGRFDYLIPKIQTLSQNEELEIINTTDWIVDFYTCQSHITNYNPLPGTPNDKSFFNQFYYKIDQNYYIRPSSFLLYDFSTTPFFRLQSTVLKTHTVTNNYGMVYISYFQKEFYSNPIYGNIIENKINENQILCKLDSSGKSWMESRKSARKGVEKTILYNNNITLEAGDTILLDLIQGNYIVSNQRGKHQEYFLSQPYSILLKSILTKENFDLWFGGGYTTDEDGKERFLKNILQENMMICYFRQINANIGPWEVIYENG